MCVCVYIYIYTLTYCLIVACIYREEIYVLSILKLLSHLRLSLSSTVIATVVLIKVLYEFLISSMCAKCPSFHNSNVCEQYKL
jgi:hypothetical protein